MAFQITGLPVKTCITLQQETLDSACEAVIMAMVNTLPEEVQTVEVFEYVLEKSNDFLKQKIIKLQQTEIKTERIPSSGVIPPLPPSSER